jgi:hypothetical protein
LSRCIRRAIFAVALVCLSSPLFADQVVPSAEVTTRVIVRASASSQSAQVGSLEPGEQVELIGSVPFWHEVQLANGSIGFVSKRWTRVIPAGVAPTPSPPASGGPTFTMDVVDVGTGLGILVRGPDFTLVYDGGSNDDDARGTSNRMLAYMRAVAPTLTTIDHLMLSHPHKDHLELLPDLLATYQVSHVWDSGRINDTCGYRAFLTAVRDEPGVQYHNALQDFGTRGYPFGQKANSYGQAVPVATLTLTQASRITETPIALGQGASMTQPECC